MELGEGVVVWEHGVIEGRGEGEVKLGRGVVVESGARVEGEVGEGSLVGQGSVVGVGCVVETVRVLEQLPINSPDSHDTVLRE